MSNRDEKGTDRPPDGLPPAERDDEVLTGDWDDWGNLPPQAMRDDVWEAFELDEETAEPEPEFGDFWGELDEDEVV